ncbi:MAG: ATP-binding protein [Deltaproteobacteria bacterium]|nr:ATP-binding protein [Deltaproteobacteria bacterium]
MYTRIFNYHRDNDQSFFLFGPRGVGKTLWLEAVVKSPNRIDLLNSRQSLSLLAVPNRLASYVVAPNEWVVVDEVQKIPELLDEVHRLIEKQRLRFILTGSSARNLKRVGTNLLGGRAVTERVFPLTAEELGEDFSLERSLKCGHLPMAYRSKSPERFLESYVATYLREEIQQEGIVRNLSGFARFLEGASFSQAQYLNISRLASEAGVDRKVVESYFGVLEDLLLAERLPPFRKKAHRKSDFHPKFFFFDAGVFRALRPQGPEDEPEMVDGAALETLVYQELRAQNAYKRAGFQFYSWKESNDLDVDLVLYGKNGLLAFEIKRGWRLRGGELDGLKAFRAKFPSAQCFYVYGGSEPRVIESIRLVPLAMFFTHTLREIFR